MRIDLQALLVARPSTMALALLNVMIAVSLLFAVLGGTRANEILATTPGPPPALSINFDPLPAAPDFGPIQERPLMHATRSYFVAPPPDAMPSAPPLPDYRFAGSLVGQDKPSVALLAERQSGVTRRVRSGDELNGWQVMSVSARRVVLKWQEETREITAIAAPLNAGLTRVPIRRQRMAGAGDTITLGTSGRTAATTTATNMEQPAMPIDPPRFYRPPPN